MTDNDWIILARYGVTPDNLTVGGSLDLRHTPITALPDNLTVAGWLDLCGTAITALPDNLTVAGWLDLSYIAITALPDNLTVAGSIYLRHTPITALPDNLTVGELDLCGTAITALPDNLTVAVWLGLSRTAITALPDNLTVGGSIDLSGTRIKPLYFDERNYRLDRAGDHYHVGCRRFTAAEAIAHWGSPKYPDKARGAAFVAAVMAEENRRNAIKGS
jgi:hypothetical protein